MHKIYNVFDAIERLIRLRNKTHICNIQNKTHHSHHPISTELENILLPIDRSNKLKRMRVLATFQSLEWTGSHLFQSKLCIWAGRELFQVCSVYSFCQTFDIYFVMHCLPIKFWLYNFFIGFSSGTYIFTRLLDWQKVKWYT